MKANELRIGNYVFDNLGGTLKIKGINEISDLSHIKPIPLTEEWLVKFGFESKDKEIYCSLHEEIEDTIEYSKNDLSIYWSYEYETYRSDNESIKKAIQCVHQLQNLYFALTGEELTIK